MMKSHVIPNVCSEYSEHYFRDYQSVIPKSTYPIAWSYYNFLSSHWLAIWCIFRRSPLSEENYPNRNPAWKQALLTIDFQGNTRKGSSTSLSVADYVPYLPLHLRSSKPPPCYRSWVRKPLSAYLGCQNVPKCSKPTFWAFLFYPNGCTKMHQNVPLTPSFISPIHQNLYDPCPFGTGINN
jgi:hypothetical protein